MSCPATNRSAPKRAATTLSPGAAATPGSAPASRTSATTIRTLLLSLLLASGSTAQLIHTVDDDAPADFATIQAAVDAAGPTDLVLVSDGTYGGFTVSRSASIVADAGADVVVEGSVLVTGTAANERVLLQGLQIEEDNLPLWILGCLGPVWVQEGRVTVGIPYSIWAGGTAAWVQLSTNVMFTGVRIECVGTILDQGVLRVDLSGVSLYDCLVDGGSMSPNVDGQPGVSVANGAFFASGSILRGARGGDGAPPTAPVFCSDGLDGGPGLRVESGSAQLLDCQLEGGEGGAAWGSCTDGATGPTSAIAPGASIDTFPGDARVSTIDAVMREGDVSTLSLQGQAGEMVWVLFGLGDVPAMLPTPNFRGVFVPGTPWLPLFVGSVPGDGTLDLPVTLGELPAGLPFVRLITQPLMGSAGAWVLGSPRMTWLLDA